MAKLKTFTRHITLTIKAESASAANAAMDHARGEIRGITDYTPGLDEYMITRASRGIRPAKSGKAGA